MLGAVFEREVQAVPRARGLFVARAVYCGALLGIVATCWLVVTGTQAVTTAGRICALADASIADLHGFLAELGD